MKSIPALLAAALLMTSCGNALASLAEMPPSGTLTLTAAATLNLSGFTPERPESASEALRSNNNIKLVSGGDISISGTGNIVTMVNPQPDIFTSVVPVQNTAQDIVTMVNPPSDIVTMVNPPPDIHTAVNPVDTGLVRVNRPSSGFFFDVSGDGIVINTVSPPSTVRLSSQAFASTESPVPIPPAFMLLGSGVAGLAALRRKTRSA